MDMAKRPVQKYNFKPFGAAIKAARNGRKESRNKVGDEMYLSPRYLANIENNGQHPSLQIFFELITRYHISVDQFLFENPADGKSTERRQLDTLLDGLDEKESGSSPQPYRLCWMKRVIKNEAPGTTEYGMKDAMNG